MTAPLRVLVARAADLGAETWRVRRAAGLAEWQDRADDRRMVVARLLFWRWLAASRRETASRVIHARPWPMRLLRRLLGMAS